MKLAKPLIIIFLIASFCSEAAVLNAFGKNISLPEDCVFRIHTAIRSVPTFYCEENFVSFLSKDKADIESLRKEVGVIRDETSKLNSLDIYRITIKHGNEERDIAHFDFVCERKDCILITGQKRKLFDSLLSKFE